MKTREIKMNALRKTALSLLKKADFGRIDLRKKMLKAALYLSLLEKVVFEGK